MLDVEFGNLKNMRRVLDNLEKEVLYFRDTAPKRQAKAFAYELKSNYVSQKLASKVPNLKDSTIKWKKRVFPGTEGKKGIMTGTLSGGITYGKIKDGYWWAGIDRSAVNKKYRNSLVGVYGRAFEKGKNKYPQPARPFTAMTLASFERKSIIPLKTVKKKLRRIFKSIIKR